MNTRFKIVQLFALTALGFGLLTEAHAAIPTIVKPPKGTSVLTGSPVNLNVQGDSATPLTYQWLFNSSPIGGATANAYGFSNAKKVNEGDYQVVLSNGSGSVTSIVARVNIVTADIPTIADSLVGHYPFEQNYNDVSPENNASSPVGGPTWTITGKTGGGGLNFSTLEDGSSYNFVTLGIPDDFTFETSTDFSVAFWIRYTTSTGEFPLIANKDWSDPNNQGWGIAAGADGRLRWNMAGAPGTAKSYDGTPNALNDGTWHHIAVTFQRSGNATTYLDGAVVNVTSLAGSANDVTTPDGLALNVGQDGTGVYTVGIDAGLDDLGIWRRVITPDEVDWIYAKAARSVNIEQNVFDITGGQVTKVTGQWDFDQGDLRASVGQALAYGDGPGAYMSTQTSFGTTTSFGIPDIGGTPAHVLKYTRSETVPDNYVQGYAMNHGIAPNGGGNRVNQWTLITDIYYPNLDEGDQYSAFIEIQNDVGSDADLAVHEESPGVGGIGISGRYPGNLTQGAWHRVVFAVDMAATPAVISKFIDGVKAADQTDADGSGLDGRFSLDVVAHLFSDGGNDNEVNDYFVNSVQIRSGKLSDDDVATLGGPQASGIPLPNQVTGQWDFDQGDLRASVGQDLVYGDGPGAYMSAQTSFGTTTSFGISDIGGAPAPVMKYTRSETVPDNYVQGYTMTHGIAPNGDGNRVNQWTLITDIYYPDLHQGDQYSAFIEIQNDVGSDADLAVHEESPGVGGIGISGRYPGNLTQGAWHRVAFAVDMAATPAVISKFIDGVKAADQTDADGSGLDGRFSLDVVAHLFSDGGNDNEVNTYFVNSVQIRSGKLSDDDVAALGGPEASGIPATIPSGSGEPQPKLVTTLNGKNLTISWDSAAAGFTLESTAALANPVWSPVAGVNNNSVAVDVSSGAKFYRLKK